MADTVGPSGATIPVSQTEWNTDQLYIHLTGKIEDLKSSMGDLRTADHIALTAALAAAEKAVASALAAQEKAVQAALLAVKEATDKQEREVTEWRRGANEWRGAMDDRESRFVHTETFDAKVGAIESRLADLTRSRDLDAGRRIAQTLIGSGLAIAIAIALRFLG